VTVCEVRLATVSGIFGCVGVCSLCFCFLLYLVVWIGGA